MKSRAEDRPRVWGVTWGLRAFFTLFGTWFAVLAVLPWSDTSSYWDGLSTRLLCLGLVVALFVVAYRPRVELQQEVIFARGILFSKQIPLTELVSARAGYDGITLSTRDGTHFTATFVGEKSNLSLLLGRRSRADDIAAALMTAARPDFVPGPRHRAHPVADHEKG